MSKIQLVKYHSLYIVPILAISTPTKTVKIFFILSLYQQYSKWPEYIQKSNTSITWASVFLNLLKSYNTYKILIYTVYKQTHMVVRSPNFLMKGIYNQKSLDISERIF